MTSGLFQDLWLGLRSLARRPALPAAAVVALALGLGAVTSVFSVVDAVLLSALPYRKPDRLVLIRETNPAKGIDATGAAPAKVVTWRQDARSFSALSAVAPTVFDLVGSGDPVELAGHQVTPGFFDLLGVRMLLGRGFEPEEQNNGGRRVVILSYGLWQRRFSGDPAAVGRTVRLNGEPFEVVGVAAPFPDPVGEPELWVPLGNIVWGNRVSHQLDVLARLADGTAVAQAREELTVLAHRQEQAYPATDTGWGVEVVPLAEAKVAGIRTSLWVLFGAVALVLVIACTNVAVVLLARALGRRRDIALRLALGAPRRAIVRLPLLESLCLAVLGGIAGLALAAAGTRAFVALAPTELPRVGRIGIDARVLLFALLAVGVSAGVAALAPILFARRLPLTEVLKEGGSRAGVGNRLQRALARLIIVEIALAAVLLVGAGLLLASFVRLHSVDPGFVPERVLTARLSLSRAGYGSQDRVRVYRQIVERAAALPGARSAAVVSRLPLSGSGESFRLLLDRKTDVTSAEQPTAEVRAVTHEYFETLGIPLETGELPRPGSDGRAAGVAVNEAFVRRFWPEESAERALGHVLSIEGAEGPWMPIVGVVGDVRHFGLGEQPVPELDLPLEGNAWPSMTLVVKTAADPLALAPALRNAIRDVDPNLPASDLRPLEEWLAASLARPRFQLTLLGLFALLALLLTTVGLWGTVAYSVRLRSHEMGVRMSLGADRGRILRQVLGGALRLALVGVVIGLVAALVATRFLRILLYEVQPADPWVLGSVALVLLATVLLAAWLPAHRAAAVEPVVALRGPDRVPSSHAG